jgi:hypothetical protein
MDTSSSVVSNKPHTRALNDDIIIKQAGFGDKIAFIDIAPKSAQDVNL